MLHVPKIDEYFEGVGQSLFMFNALKWRISEVLLEFHIDISWVAGFPFFKSATNCWCDIANLCDAAILYLSKKCDVPLLKLTNRA